MAQTDLAFPIVDNIVIGCPRNSEATADFYARLLQMRVIREDWLMIAKGPDTEPRLAFDDDLDPDRVASWLDPDRPAQVHLDLPTADLDSAAMLATQLGAVLVEQDTDVAVFADPAGHPFCLYVDREDDHVRPVDHPLSGRIGRVVIDCASPRSLAGFYAGFLDMPDRLADDADWIVIGRSDGRMPALAFRQSYAEPPRWPDPAFPQQMHLDIWVDDADTASAQAISAGATELPAMGGSCPVFADPAGHPFCICT
jgi:catechol 2,3-dioxygenase-like lactoylglutathione lyase family enzyme